MTREKFVHFKNEKKSYIIFRSESMNPFGGMRRRGFGISYEYGSIGSTYGDPSSNMAFTIIVSFWRWDLSMHYCWKR